MMKNINKISGLISIIILPLILSFILLIFLNGYFIKNDINESGKFSIGKFVSYRKWGKGQTNYFNFYIDGIKYKGESNTGDNEGKISNIGKFYKIRYSEKFKGSLIAYFDNEIKDTLKIKNEGFTKIEILSNEQDELNYIETSFIDELIVTSSSFRSILIKN